MGDSWLSVKSKIQIDENGQTDCLKKSHTHTRTLQSFVRISFQFFTVNSSSWAVLLFFLSY